VGQKSFPGYIAKAAFSQYYPMFFPFRSLQKNETLHPDLLLPLMVLTGLPATRPLALDRTARAEAM
jgi:hypothetical protein